MRIILKHPYQRKKKNKRLAYLASNITIKEYTNSKLNFPNAEDIFKTKDYNKKYFEFYYKLLLDNLDESLENNLEKQKKIFQNSKNNSENQKNSSQNPQNSTKNNDYYNNYIENTKDWQEDDFNIQNINDKIKYIISNDNWGDIPQYLQERIIATLKPKLNYKAILRNFKASIISSKKILTRMKPSRRYGFLYMGSKYDFNSKLLFAVDVSGSIDYRSLRNGFSVINNIFSYGIKTIDVIEFDTEIKGKKREIKKAFREIKITGRGGTDFQPIFDYLKENNIYDGVIIFTDGYAPVPLIPPKIKARVVWLFNNESNYNSMKNRLKKTGVTMYINPE